ncbi:MAG: glycosyltransferase family 4 protein, partial [Longicatena sp.]
HDVTCYNRKGHHVSGQEYDNATKENSYKGINIKTVFTIDKKGLAAATSSFFASIRVAFGKYDVVHYHAEGPCAMMWIPKLFGKKCVATIHGLDWTRPKWSGFSRKYIRYGEKIAVKYADEIIVLNEAKKNYFLETYNRKTILIPNGVNKPDIKKAKEITEKFGLRKNSYILYLGRIVPGKGLNYLIKAYKNITTDKKLVIAGGTSDTDEYMKELKVLV